METVSPKNKGPENNEKTCQNAENKQTFDLKGKIDEKTRENNENTYDLLRFEGTTGHIRVLKNVLGDRGDAVFLVVASAHKSLVAFSQGPPAWCAHWFARGSKSLRILQIKETPKVKPT